MPDPFDLSSSHEQRSNRKGLSLLDLLFPPRCGGCGTPGSWICGRCRAVREPARAPALPHLRSVVSLGVFAGPLRAAVHRLKYTHEFILADALGAELGAVLARGLALGWRVDSVVPVPLAESRARQRGHDQAERLAGACAVVSGVRLRRALRRVRDTRSQVGLGRNERATNVRGAFAAEPMLGQSVALIDDVLTTGSTLSECARTLRRSGAREVRALVVAIER